MWRTGNTDESPSQATTFPEGPDVSQALREESDNWIRGDCQQPRAEAPSLHTRGQNNGSSEAVVVQIKLDSRYSELGIRFDV